MTASYSFLPMPVLKEVSYAIKTIESLLPGWDYSITLWDTGCTIDLNPSCIGGDARLLQFHEFKSFSLTTRNTHTGLCPDTILRTLNYVAQLAYAQLQRYNNDPKGFRILSEMENRVRHGELKASPLVATVLKNGLPMFTANPHSNSRALDVLEERLEILATNPFLTKLVLSSNGFYSTLGAYYGTKDTDEKTFVYDPYLLNCAQITTHHKTDEMLRDGLLFQCVEDGLVQRFKSFEKVIHTFGPRDTKVFAHVVDDYVTFRVEIGETCYKNAVKLTESFASMEKQLTPHRTLRVVVVGDDDTASRVLEL